MPVGTSTDEKRGFVPLAAASTLDRLVDMSEHPPHRLLASAGDLLGREELSLRLGVDREVLEAWIRGEGTVPSVKLSLLTLALAEFAARRTC